MIFKKTVDNYQQIWKNWQTALKSYFKKKTKKTAIIENIILFDVSACA